MLTNREADVTVCYQVDSQYLTKRTYNEGVLRSRRPTKEVFERDERKTFLKSHFVALESDNFFFLADFRRMLCFRNCVSACIGVVRPFAD